MKLYNVYVTMTRTDEAAIWAESEEEAKKKIQAILDASGPLAIAYNGNPPDDETVKDAEVYEFASKADADENEIAYKEALADLEE